MSIKENIIEQYKNGNIVIAAHDGLQVYSLEEFVAQPIEGILYDLNRLEMVVLAFIEDPKWVNDFAVSKTIRLLKHSADYYKKRCELAEKYISESPCDPDITKLQFEAWNEYQEFIKDTSS